MTQNIKTLQAIASIEKQIELDSRLLGDISNSVKVAVGINVNNKPPEPSEDVVTLAHVFTAEQLQEIPQPVTRIQGIKRYFVARAQRRPINQLTHEGSQAIAVVSRARTQYPGNLTLDFFNLQYYGHRDSFSSLQ